jgi:hypothetical protein
VGAVRARIMAVVSVIGVGELRPVMLTTLASAAVTAIATSATAVVPANLPRVIIDRTIPP